MGEGWRVVGVVVVEVGGGGWVVGGGWCVVGGGWTIVV